MTFSIGTTPAAASPAATASKTARKLATARRSTSPNATRTASSANAPGSPAYATEVIDPGRVSSGATDPGGRACALLCEAERSTALGRLEVYARIGRWYQAMGTIGLWVFPPIKCNL